MAYKLECAESFSAKDATEADINFAFDDDARRGEYLSLTAPDGSFLQAAGEDDEDEWAMTQRDEQSEEHIEVQGELTKEQVRAAFLSYLRGDSSWRSAHQWEPLKSSGCMSIIILAIGLFTFMAAVAA